MVWTRKCNVRIGVLFNQNNSIPTYTKSFISVQTKFQITLHLNKLSFKVLQICSKIYKKKIW